MIQRDVFTFFYLLFAHRSRRMPSPQVFDASDPLHRDFVLSAAGIRFRVMGGKESDGNIYRGDNKDSDNNSNSGSNSGISVDSSDESTNVTFTWDELLDKIVEITTTGSSSQVKDNPVRLSNLDAHIRTSLKHLEHNNNDTLARANLKEHLSQLLVRQGASSSTSPKRQASIFSQHTYPEEFEKDDAALGHVHCVTAMTNLRNWVYQIPEVDELEVQKVWKHFLCYLAKLK